MQLDRPGAELIEVNQSGNEQTTRMDRAFKATAQPDRVDDRRDSASVVV